MEYKNTPKVAPAAKTGTEYYLLQKGGPSLLDLRLSTSELHILVTGPGMLFERLKLLTSLSVIEGCDIHQLHRLAKNIEGRVLCGGTGIERLPVKVVTHRTGATLEIDLGPASMYQTEIILQTISGESFDSLLSRLLSPEGNNQFMAALYAVPATAHLEHHIHHHKTNNHKDGAHGSKMKGGKHGHS